MRFDFNELDRFLTQAVLARIDKKGVDGSGAHAHYNALAKSGSILQPRLRTFAEKLMQDATNESVFYEIGDGAGMLSLVLFAMGANTVVISPETQRSALAVALARTLKADFLKTERTIRVLNDHYPSVLTALLLEQAPHATLISMDTVNEAFSNSENSLINAISTHTQAYINISKLARSRGTPDEQDALIQQFVRRGMHVNAELNIDTSSRFVHLTKVPTAKAPVK